MNNIIDEVLVEAADKCSHSGGRLTEKRKKILEILLRSSKPLSVYEILDIYNKKSSSPMQAMSVYRILDYLETEELVHKISLTNKFVACSHISCEHEHTAAQFLICSKCEQVSEIAIDKNIIVELSKQVLNAGYTLVNSQLEFDCICSKCDINAI